MQLTSDSINWKLVLCLLLLAGAFGLKFLGSDNESEDNYGQTDTAFTDDTADTQSAPSSANYSQSSFASSTPLTTEQTKTKSKNPFAVDTPETVATVPTSTDIEGEEFLPTGDETDVSVVFEKWLNDTFDLPDEGVSTASNSANSGVTSKNNRRSDADASQQFDEETDFAPDLAITAPASLEVQSERIDTTEYTIAGRVISTHGGPIEGLAINAQLRGVSSFEKASAAGTTQTDGSFTLAQLPAGDYMLRVEGDDNHEGTSQIVRAGDASTLIELVAIQQWHVSGTVTDNLGNPIAGVIVRPPAGAEPTTTDGGGAFSMQFATQDSGGLLMRYEAEGYTSTLRHIVGQELKQHGTIDASVQMQSNGALYVAGNVTNDLGEPISKAHITLRSRNPAYERSVHADEAGYFVLPDVAPTQSASVKVTAGNRYQPFAFSNVSLQEDYNFDITLQNSAVTSLTAMLTDSEGNGISAMNFLSLSAAKGGASQMATSDSNGLLMVENLKPGKLLLRSTAKSPSIVVKGIDVVAGGSNEHKIVVDIGPYTLQGRILDENGDAIAAADLSMVHVINENGLESVTTRKVKSEADGSFVFSGLGTGERYITIASSAHGEQSFAMDPSVDTNGEPLVLY